MRLLKLLADRTPPEKCEERRKRFVKALQQLWVAGTAGALFFSVAETLPQHLAESTSRPDWDYTLRVLLKYLYLVWFVLYFCVSAMDNEEVNAPREIRDLGFDIVQSACAILAAYYLGFIGPPHDVGRVAFLMPNVAIGLICGLALLIYRGHARVGVNRLRWTGMSLATVGAIVAGCFDATRSYLLILLVVQLALCLVLAAYLRIGFDEPPQAVGAKPRMDRSSSQHGQCCRRRGAHQRP